MSGFRAGSTVENGARGYTPRNPSGAAPRCRAARRRELAGSGRRSPQPPWRATRTRTVSQPPTVFDSTARLGIRPSCRGVQGVQLPSKPSSLALPTMMMEEGDDCTNAPTPNLAAHAQSVCKDLLALLCAACAVICSLTARQVNKNRTRVAPAPPPDCTGAEFRPEVFVCDQVAPELPLHSMTARLKTIDEVVPSHVLLPCAG